LSEQIIASLVQQVAKLEARLNGKSESAPQTPKFDPRDVMGSLASIGADPDYVTKVLVARALEASGHPVPPQLQMAAQMGPQMAQTDALRAQVESLSRQISDLTAAQSKGSVRESFSKAIADKSKYPHLSKAYAQNPALFQEQLDAHQGDASELATKMESQLTSYAAVFGVAAPTPSTADGDDDDGDESTNVTPANPGANGELPPASKTADKGGLFTQEDHERLKAEVLKNFPSE
jgi:hypothetical protein